MGDNEEDVNRGRRHSKESSSFSVDELQSIQSLSSLSDSSLELPPQAASVRIQRACPQRIPSTAFYVGALDQEEDNISRNSSHFSLGLDLSAGLHGAHRVSQTSSEKRSGTASRHRRQSILLSLESSDQEDDNSESSLMDDHMEIAALIAKAKQETNQDPVTTPQQNDTRSRQPRENMGLNDSLLGRSAVHQKIPTKIKVDSPSQAKSSMVEPLETEKSKSGATSIPSPRNLPIDQYKQQESTTKLYHKETRSSQKLSWESSLSYPYSIEKEKRASESPQQDWQSLESDRKSQHQSIVLELDRQMLIAKMESKRIESQLTDKQRQSCEARREHDEIMARAKQALHRHTLATTRGQKSKEMQTDHTRVPFSGSKRNERIHKIFERVGSQQPKLQEKLSGPFSWERSRSSKQRKKVADETQRRSWNGEKKEDKRIEFKAKIGGGYSYKPKATSVETNDEPPMRKEKPPVSQARKETNKVILPQAETNRDFLRTVSRSTQTDRQDKDEGETMFIPKVDYRTISEKLKDSFNSGRQDKPDSRISYQSRQLEHRTPAPRENENHNSLRRDFKLESRQDSFGGERLLHIDHNRRSEMSSITFKCRPLSEKARLMKMYREKEKVANEFITKWSKLSETTTKSSYMRQNGLYGYEPKYTSEPWLSGRANGMPRISSLTQEFPRTGLESTTPPPNVPERHLLGSKKKRWVCDICEVANFESYAACFVHEKNCTGAVRKNTKSDYPPTAPQERSWLLNE